MKPKIKDRQKKPKSKTAKVKKGNNVEISAGLKANGDIILSGTKQTNNGTVTVTKVIDKVEKKLTEKERLFCAYYSGNGRNGAKAARDAGYSENTAREIACENLTKPHIIAEIERLTKDDADRYALIGITKQNIVLKHWEIANSSIAHLHNSWIELSEFENLTPEQKACIKEIDTKVEKRTVTSGDLDFPAEIKWVRICLYDKQKALDSISKLMGYDAPVKTELSNPDGSLLPITSIEVVHSMYEEKKDEKTSD